MKRLHRKDLFGWSVFDEGLDIDFNSVAWIREGGNVLIDPLPLTPHDEEHLRSLGGAAWIVITNSAHVRAAEALAVKFGARLAGPADEKGEFPIACARWLEDGEEVVPGLVAFTLDGSKTPGELALLLERSTLIAGDLIRSHQAGSLMMLADAKLESKSDAERSVWRLLDQKEIDAVLVGDGWHVFRDGWTRLHEVVAPVVAEAKSARVGFQARS